MLICFTSQCFIFGVLAHLISTDVMSTVSWISFACNILPMNIMVLIILIPSAYLNEEINTQIKTLLRVREVYQRLVRDDDILR